MMIGTRTPSPFSPEVFQLRSSKNKLRNGLLLAFRDPLGTLNKDTKAVAT